MSMNEAWKPVRWRRRLGMVAVAAHFLGPGMSQAAGFLEIQSGERDSARIEMFQDLDRVGTYRIEGSSNLQQWAPEPLAFFTTEEVGGSLEWSVDTRISLESRSQPDRRFYRSRFLFVERGRLVSWSLEREISRAELDLVFQFLGVADRISANHDVKAYRIVYETVSVTGESTLASGAVAMPSEAGGPLPTISYQHGTVIKKDRVPSQFAIDQEAVVPVAMAADGYLAVAADYLGLGESEGRHPYLVAKISATAVIDMLRAARALAQELGVAVNERLFLAGYSQGGHVTLAAQRAMERDTRDTFSLTASAPMAGPYDLSETTFDRALNATYPRPSFVAYLLLAYNEVYRMAPSTQALFAEPYASRIESLYDGEHTISEIESELPENVRELLDPGFLSEVERDSEHPFRLALRENDLLEWAPQAPTRLYHCADDRVVPKANSEIALERFQAEGAADVELIEPASGGHADCSLPSILAAKEWFDELR